jgi:hypothetical protein
MPKEWFKQIVLTMASSPPLNRRRILGLNDPRSARAQANDTEIQRLAMRQMVQENNANLDIPDSSSSDEFNLDSPSPPISSLPQQREPQQPAISAPIQRRAAPPALPRNRYFWAGNNVKLNLLASKYYHQPMRQEIAAHASRSPDSIEEIRLLKRDTTKDLDFDNLKHSGKVFLVQKTCEELNECEEFKAHMPEGVTLGVELCRQKIKEFFDIAVATPDDQIDIRN